MWVLLGLTLLSGVSAVKKLQDPWGHFCGKDNCYDLLGVPRGTEKQEIRRAYRALSLQHHPDKNRGRTTDVAFSKIAKAYEILMNDEKHTKYDHMLDHPDAYWEEYGHHWVMEYAPTSDVRFVIIGLLLFISIFQPALQYNRYRDAVKAIAKAADEGLGPRNGGNATTQALRKRAEEVLAERKKQHDEGAKGNGASNGTGSNGNSTMLPPGAKPIKKTRQELALEQRKALSALIYELAVEVEIQGAHGKPKLRNVPIVYVALLPYRLAERLWRVSKWRLQRMQGKPADREDREYWAKVALGRDTWETLLPEEREDAIGSSGAWEGGEALEAWKGQHLVAGTLPSQVQEKAPRRELRRRKRAGDADGDAAE